ncbi:hypothetical protein [Pseudoduganella sp. OTU4001]|uniref:hypothetical protein n=1 Tax=Pseudoduganella sp. OTU4001 TaxID=3043854 RepID=UPI00313AA8F5
MDSMLHLKPADTWLLSRGMRARHHLLAPAQPGRSAALPPFGRWRGLDTIAAPLLEHLRQCRADCAYAQRLDLLQQSVARAERQLPQLTARQPWQVTAAGPVLGGDALLASWHLLFMAGGVALASPGPLGREFATYACHVAACLRQLHEALASFDMLLQQAAAPQRQAALAALGERLLAWGDALVDDEVADEVMLRVQNYPVLYEEMQEMADGGSDEAAASLESLGDMDLDRLDWAGGQRSGLLKALDRLRGTAASN